MFYVLWLSVTIDFEDQNVRAVKLTLWESLFSDCEGDPGDEMTMVDDHRTVSVQQTIFSMIPASYFTLSCEIKRTVWEPYLMSCSQITACGFMATKTAKCYQPVDDNKLTGQVSKSPG